MNRGNITFFESASMHHALMVIKERHGDNGIILFQNQFTDSKKIFTCSCGYIEGITNHQLKALANTVKFLIKNGFSQYFIVKAYTILESKIHIIHTDEQRYLELIFNQILESDTSIMGKNFTFIGAFGAGKTTVLTKFVKNCIDNTLYPNVYYCAFDNRKKAYDIALIVKKLQLSLKTINLSEIGTLSNNSVSFIDNQGIDFEAKQDKEAIVKFMEHGIVPIYVIRSDLNISTIKSSVITLKKMGVKYFVINHYGSKKFLGIVISILIEQEVEILAINTSGVLNDPILIDVPYSLSKLFSITTLKERLSLNNA